MYTTEFIEHSGLMQPTDNEDKFWNGQPLAPLKQPPEKETCREKKEANVITIGKSCKKWKLIYQISCGLLVVNLRFTPRSTKAHYMRLWGADRVKRDNDSR